MRWPFRINTGRRWVAGIVVLGTVTMAGSACQRTPGAAQHVTIPSGTSFRVVADSLAHAGIIRWPRLFRLYASLNHEDRDVKPGLYLLPRGSSWQDALDALTEGRGMVHVVTIPEGWDLTAIIPVLAHALNADSDSVVVATRDTALLDELDVPTASLEGYLFPDTYAFPDGTSPRTAIRTMTAEFVHVWRPEWDSAARALGLTRHEAVTLASIIEKEARFPEERPIISAVYHNRLRLHMPLQADPTVQYALGHHVARVLYRDLAVPSNYNTYRHLGLPPGPIASPGAASLDAAVNPAEVPYLYFVAEPDGHHQFSTTFAQHTAARKKLRHPS